MICDKNTIGNIIWRKINMRNVGHLMGVEFIHDLYNRYVPRINFIRFRNTVTIWKDGIVSSYAPEKDFELLEKYFGEKFYILDNTVLREFELLLNSDRKFFDEQVSRFENTDLKELSNLQVGLFLMDIQQYSLGELYKMNFVQAEYSLTSAIKRILKEEFSNEEKINEIFSKIITTNVLTEYQAKENDFFKILSLKKEKNEKITENILYLIKNHFDNFGYMSCAYGEDPFDFDYYVKKFELFDPTTKHYSPEEIKLQLDSLYDDGKKILAELNNHKLSILVPLMIRGGTFRDKNKANLGYTIEHKHKVFEEIANRKLETRENLNYYLLSEILRLLDENTKVKQETINQRKIDGIVLIRSEYLDISEGFRVMDFKLPVKDVQQEIVKDLHGRCACSGLVKGIAKIVLNKKDGAKVKKGDIMVAVGTDFDLLDAIHRSTGVITEEGGLLSHASVVCREMKKACLIGVKDATNAIKDGDLIILDSKKGKVTIQ